MTKNAKIIIAIILVIVVIIICCFTFGKNKEKSKDEDMNESIIVNEIEEDNLNVVNKINEGNIIKNEIKEEIIQNITEIKKQGTVYESNSNAGTTDKKQDAIALVKEKWGEDSTVTFRCDSVSNNGEYIIAVVSKESATVKNYFKVNLVTKTVEIDY